MERAVALKKLRRLLGPKFGYRIDANAPSAEDREAAKAKLAVEIAERNRLRDMRDAREKAILAVDAEYQMLKANTKAASARVDALQHTAHFAHKITVGTVGSMFFSVAAQGDSWEEIFAKLEKKADA